MEPVVCAPDDPYALTEEDLPILFEQYEILAKEMLKREKEGRPLTFYHYMLDLTGMALASIREFQAAVQRYGIYGSNTLGRPVSLPSVCRR